MKRRSFFASFSALLGFLGLGGSLPVEAAAEDRQALPACRTRDVVPSILQLAGQHAVLWRQLRQRVQETLDQGEVLCIGGHTLMRTEDMKGMEYVDKDRIPYCIKHGQARRGPEGYWPLRLYGDLDTALGRMLKYAVKETHGA